MANKVNFQENISNELKKHQNQADLAYAMKSKDKELSKNDEKLHTITFDMQQCLPAPVISSSLTLNKRQLWTYNLTIHDCDNGQGHCFLWNETVGNRGANNNNDIVNEDETKDVEIGTSTLDKVIDSCINNVSFIQNETVSIGNKDNANIDLNLNVIESNDHQQFLSNELIPNIFKKPEITQLNQFFKHHPQKPKLNEEIPFNFQKAFFRSNGSERKWLTYNKNPEQLFCYVCLAFSTDSNNFVKGLDVWSHTYIRIDEHEKSTTHKNCVSAFFLHSNEHDIGSLLFSENKNEIKKNREIITRVIEVVKLIGKRGLSYRGNQFEAAYTLSDPFVDHGNFLEIILFLAKYDFQMKDHLEMVIKKSHKAHESGSKGRGGLVTFLSKTTVDYIIAAISRLIKKYICHEVENAKMYAVMLDTTQDITSSDQCSVVLRYVDDNGIHESLIAVVNCSDSTGKGMHSLLQNVLLLNNLNITNCIANTTDGAANMQGEYNGFSTWLNESSPYQVHVWCYSHVLNLVLLDASKLPLAAASLFDLCNSLAVFFKDSHKRMRVWTERCHSLNQRLQSIGETRWWSKEVALIKIFGSTEGPSKSNALYVDVLMALYDIINDEKSTPDTRVKAETMKNALLNFSTILTAYIYLRIFSITGPLSRYLQSKSMDLITAQNLVDGALEQLEKVQRNMEWIKLSADSFVVWANTELDLRFDGDSPIIVNEILPNIRTRKKKMLPGEISNDNLIHEGPLKKFEIEVHNIILDTVVESIKKRFIKHRKLYNDLSCLSPTYFPYIIQNGLPDQALTTLCEKLNNLNLNITYIGLKDELIHFAKNWDKLKKSIAESFATSYSFELIQEEEYDIESKINPESQNTTCKSCKNCVVCCYNILQKYYLYCDAYSYLFLAYKYVLTLPSTQVSCERSFSFLKNIKTRLRSQLSDPKLEAFMLMAIEKQKLALLDSDTIIDEVQKESSLLKKKLSL
ncbi:hypothetical protein QTP88_007098 [Uroleucon formosanum]